LKMGNTILIHGNQLNPDAAIEAARAGEHGLARWS
jgi:methyl-accepting chemotaxis protein